MEIGELSQLGDSVLSLLDFFLAGTISVLVGPPSCDARVEFTVGPTPASTARVEQ